MPDKLKKMIGIVILVCSVGGVSCVGLLGESVDRVTGKTNGANTQVNQ